MDSGQASVTALGASLMRAIHSSREDPALIDDSWGDRLVLPAEREAIGQAAAAGLGPAGAERMAAFGSSVDIAEAALRAHPTYATVILRTRYAEDALAAAVAGGTRQYVLVGAGMDSFALRGPAFADEVDVFEVDLPATQEFKRTRLDECGVALPKRLHLVAADLSEETLDQALTRSLFRPDARAFFSWLGVTTYLTREANLATLQAIARCGAPGSELVFTYMDQREFDGEPGSGELQKVRETLTSAGEPWVSGFHPAELADALDGVGLALVEDLGGEDLRARYDAVALRPSAAIHIVHARRPESA